MTLQYQQDAINLQGILPFAFTTPDATTFILELGELTAPNSSAVVVFSGGGSDPADPATSNYSVQGRVIYDNATGITVPGAELIVLTPTGAPVAIGATADPTGTRMLIRVNGLAFPYDHRLNFTRILF